MINQRWTTQKVLHKINASTHSRNPLGFLMIAGFVLLFAAPLTALAQQGEVQVTGEGMSGYYANDLSRSKEESLEAAFRDAVEKASGVIVEAESTMRNYELVKDEVLTRSKGFIREYKILQEGVDKGIYRTSIEAVVVRATFMKDMEDAVEALYRRVGKPRMMIAISEQGLDDSGKPLGDLDGVLKGVAEKQIRRTLIKRGFTFIDTRHDSVLVKASTGDGSARERLLRTAKTDKADLLVLGQATTQRKGVVSGFNTAQADLSLDVIRVDNGQVVASELQSSRGLDLNRSTAAVKSVQKAADEILPRMMEQVTYVWLQDKSQGSRMELVVTNATFAQMVGLRRALTSQVPGSKAVQQRSYKNNAGLIEFQTRKTSDQVAEGLMDIRFPDFKLVVERVERNKIIVKVANP